jgi:hypothetical protein
MNPCRFSCPYPAGKPAFFRSPRVPRSLPPPLRPHLVIAGSTRNLSAFSSVLYLSVFRRGRCPQRPAVLLYTLSCRGALCAPAIRFLLSVILSAAKNLISSIPFSHFARGESLLLYGKSNQKRSGLRPAPTTEFLHISCALSVGTPSCGRFGGVTLAKSGNVHRNA